MLIALMLSVTYTPLMLSVMEPSEEIPTANVVQGQILITTFKWARNCFWTSHA